MKFVRILNKFCVVVNVRVSVGIIISGAYKIRTMVKAVAIRMNLTHSYMFVCVCEPLCI